MGWWEEAFSPDLGWAIGGAVAPDDADIDAIEAEELYKTIERSVAPEFYDRDASGIPLHWLARVRRSMAVLTPTYSSNRMALDYVTQAYLPAARSYAARAKDGGQIARDLQAWAARLTQRWPNLHLGAPTRSRSGDCWTVSAPIYFGEMQQDDIQVELYADPLEGGVRMS